MCEHSEVILTVAVYLQLFNEFCTTSHLRVLFQSEYYRIVPRITRQITVKLQEDTKSCIRVKRFVVL